MRQTLAGDRARALRPARSRSDRRAAPGPAALASVCALLGACFDPPTKIGPGLPPTVQQITAEPDVIAAGSVALLTAGFTDPEGERLRFEWSVEAGEIVSAPVEGGDYGPGIQWLAPAQPGVYRVDVVATDPAGLSDEGRLFVAVVQEEVPEPGDTPPEIVSMSAAPASLVLGESALVMVEATDVDGDPLTYEWLMGIGDGDAEGTETDWAPIPGLCCTGTYPIGVKVRDGRGGSDTYTVSVYVEVN